MRRDLPDGTVTFLFTDVEGSTGLLHELGADGYVVALAEHRRLVREAFAAHAGVEVDTQGDAFFVAFPDAAEAVAAAAAVTESLGAGPIRVRMGLHTGRPHLTEEGYVGEDVHLGARIASAGHGGQVLVSQATCALVEAELIDLGEHRLKDFGEPVSIFQLGSERFPPLKTISNTNLPRPVSSFVGREREVAEVTALVRDGARLVTLSGPCGTGKTRLAIEAAAELVPEFKAGVFWIGLAPLRDPSLVVETVAQTLGAKDGLAAHIGERELLLLLDNLEQVIDAAPGLADLLEACPNLRLLVTSRELLRVRGEVDYAVLPLADPDAAELFAARAGVEADETVAELCRRLDNLPLALELAAARTAVLSPEQILERLAQRLDLLKGGRDADPRQQTLRATIEWSYKLLDDDEQRLFARLSVFRGGAALDAAEQVAGAELDTIQSLVDKSLVRHTNERFWMLETIREYATEQLDDNAARKDHADYYLALAEEAEPKIKRGSPQHWLNRLSAEYDNLRAALDRLEAAGETQAVLQMTGALWSFWQVRGPLAEGRARLSRALAADERPTLVRARALAGSAMLDSNDEDTAVLRRRAEEALHIFEEQGDAWGMAHALQVLGVVPTVERDWEAALPLLEQSLGLFREVGDDHYVLVLTRTVAWVHEEMGDIAGYRARVEEYLAGARALGNKRVLARGVGAKAMWKIEEGELEEALPLMEESIAIDRELGFSAFIAIDLVRFAAILVRRGRAADAAQLVALADRICDEGAITHESWAQRERDETDTLARTQLHEAAYAEARERGRKLDVDEALALTRRPEAPAGGIAPARSPER
ncbi:MAG: ATP-binding protein [Gaiellaceae bacterium]